MAADVGRLRPRYPVMVASGEYGSGPRYRYSHASRRPNRAGRRIRARALSFCTLHGCDRAERIARAASIRLNGSRFWTTMDQPAPNRHGTADHSGWTARQTAPGNILGAAIGDGGLTAREVGRTELTTTRAYAAVTGAKARSRPKIGGFSRESMGGAFDSAS